MEKGVILLQRSISALQAFFKDQKTDVVFVNWCIWWAGMREKERMRDIRIEVEEMESWPKRKRNKEEAENNPHSCEYSLLNFIHT